MIEDGFLPDSTQGYTVLTNENLIQPINIQRSGDYLFSSYNHPQYGYIEFTELIWNDNLPSPVCGPFDGQSLSVIMIPVGEYTYDWWLVKNNNPFINGWPNQTNGTFSGYVYDQNYIPVSNARIDYIDSYIIQFPYNGFDTLTTNNTGYFSIPIMPARNYYISNIFKNNQPYIINQYVSIEPDSVNFYEFTIDYIVGYQELEANKEIEILNLPNPFSKTTEFIIRLKENQYLDNAQIKIFDLEGKTISLLSITGLPVINGQIKIKWLISSRLSAGQYIYSLMDDHNILATGKMTISK